MSSSVSAERVDAIRSFSRFYTRVIGVLDEGLLQTPYSLAEARVLFELGSRGTTELGELRRELVVDAGYLSRMLARLAADGLLTRTRSAADGRRQTVRLTERGAEVFRLLDRRSAEQVRTLLAPLRATDQERLVDALHTVTRLLDGRGRSEIALRDLQPGDLEWVVRRHGALYNQEYGWDASFEALVATIVAGFEAEHNATRERGWIAEVDGRPAGCIFCMRKDDETAQLRLLLVEPDARGLGLGRALVDACVDFARRAGYARIVLWTNDVLAEARRIYERKGFALVEEGPHRSFGHDLVEQVWALDL